MPEENDLLVTTCACGQKMKVPQSTVGKAYKCVRCGEHVQVSEANSQPPKNAGGRIAALFQASDPEPVGQLLIKAGLINAAQLGEALAMQKEKGGKTFENLMWLGYLHKDQLHEVLSRQAGIAAIDLSRVSIDRELIRLIPRKIALESLVLPIDRLGKLLTVAMACPIDFVTIAEVETITGLKVKALLCKFDDIHRAVQKYYPLEGEGGRLTMDLHSLPGIWEEPSRSAQGVASGDIPLDPELEALLRDIKSLPIAPDTMKKLKRAGASASDLANAIAEDPAAAACVLRAANQAVYGLHRGVDTIALAVLLLGAEGVAVAVKTAGEEAPAESAPAVAPAIRARARFQAACAQALALRSKRVEPGVAQTIALLQSMGALACAAVKRDPTAAEANKLPAAQLLSQRWLSERTTAILGQVAAGDDPAAVILRVTRRIQEKDGPEKGWGESASDLALLGLSPQQATEAVRGCF